MRLPRLASAAGLARLMLKHPPRLERLPLPLEMPDIDNARDELDAFFSDEVLVLALRVFHDETDGTCARVHNRVLDRSCAISLRNAMKRRVTGRHTSVLA